MHRILYRAWCILLRFCLRLLLLLLHDIFILHNDVIHRHHRSGGRSSITGGAARIAARIVEHNVDGRSLSGRLRNGEEPTRRRDQKKYEMQDQRACKSFAFTVTFHHIFFHVMPPSSYACAGDTGSRACR